MSSRRVSIARVRALVPLLATLLLAACDCDPAFVRYEPETATLPVGDTLRVQVVLEYGTARCDGTPTASWTTSNAAVASVTDGLIRALTIGAATITATSVGERRTTTVTVVPAAVASVRVLVPTNPMSTGDRQRATAEPLDRSGRPLPGRLITWTSSNAAVATIDATLGEITAVAPGDVTITATSDGVSASAGLTVVTAVRTVQVTLPSPAMLVGATQQATAALRSATNAPVARPITWSSSAPQVAAVQPMSGLVTAVGAGRATITATADGVAGSATLDVGIVPVLDAVAPAVVDAVFTDVPLTLTGRGFGDLGALDLSLSGGGPSVRPAAPPTPTSLAALLAIPGGQATLTASLTARTPFGQSAAVPLQLFSVGTAPLQRSPLLGAVTTDARTVDCPAGEVLIGLVLQHDDDLAWVQGQCATVTGSERVIGAPTTVGEARELGGLTSTRTCPAGTVMTGVAGRRHDAFGGATIDQLTVACTPTTWGPATTLAPVAPGREGSAAVTGACAVGLVATGFEAWTDDYLAGVRLRCR